MLKVANSIINASQIKTPITFVGDVTLSTGNLVIGTSGKGIDFSATSGTGTSELLDDYEEGTWTPSLTASTSGTITLSLPTDSMRYTKVGRLVNISGGITVSSVSSPVGDLRLTGLPFSIGFNSAGSISLYNFLNISVSTAYQVLLDAGLPTTIVIRGYLNGDQVNTVANNITTNSAFYLSASYSI